MESNKPEKNVINDAYDKHLIRLTAFYRLVFGYSVLLIYRPVFSLDLAIISIIPLLASIFGLITLCSPSWFYSFCS